MIWELTRISSRKHVLDFGTYTLWVYFVKWIWHIKCISLIQLIIFIWQVECILRIQFIHTNSKCDFSDDDDDDDYPDGDGDICDGQRLSWESIL